MLTEMTFAALLAVLGAPAASGSDHAPTSPSSGLRYAQAEAVNPAEFTLTSFTDPARGLSFQRPTSWTQDRTFKSGVRFAGGDEWLELQVFDSKQTPAQYAAAFKLPTAETRLGLKPYAQGTLRASVLSSSAQGKSGVTGKPLSLLTDRWIFAPRAGRLAVLTVTGPGRVFDWEGNRDMALSVRIR